MSTCCDIAQSSTSSDLILEYPAAAHSLASPTMSSSTIVELDDGPPMVLALRSFQSTQPNKERQGVEALSDHLW